MRGLQAAGLENGALVIADKGYDADSIRAHIRSQGRDPQHPEPIQPPSAVTIWNP